MIRIRNSYAPHILSTRIQVTLTLLQVPQNKLKREIFMWKPNEQGIFGMILKKLIKIKNIS